MTDSKSKILPITSNDNQQREGGETEVNLNRLSILIHRAIVDFENKLREDDPYIDGYEEIAMLIGIHPQTLRKYTNRFNPTYPTISNLISICKITGDSKPIDFVYDYWNKIK